MLPVRHREIVGLEIAVARAPEDRPGRGGHQTRPAGLRARVVDQLDLEPGAAGGCAEALKLLDAGVGQRDAQAPDLAPVGRRAVMPLQAAEGRDRIHGEPDPVRRAADLANEPGRLRRRRGGERRVLLDQQHVRHTGLGEPIRDRAADRAAAHDHHLGVAELAHFAAPRASPDARTRMHHPRLAHRGSHARSTTPRKSCSARRTSSRIIRSCASCARSRTTRITSRTRCTSAWPSRRITAWSPSSTTTSGSPEGAGRERPARGHARRLHE